MIFFLTTVFYTLSFFASSQALVECEGSNVVCIHIENCHVVADELKMMVSNKSTETQQYFMSKHCGYEGSDPQVCCPKPELEERKNRKSRHMQPDDDDNSILDDNKCGDILWLKKLSPDGSPTEVEEFPWLVLLEFGTPAGKKLGCGGVLISDRHVLTAAHCLDPMYNLIGVRLGEHNIDTTENCVQDGPDSKYCIGKPVVAEIKKMIPHENYSYLRGPFDFLPEANDIALLILNDSVSADHIKPICLPSEHADGKFLTAGWGVKSPSDKSKHSHIKRMSRFKLVEKRGCEDLIGQTLQEDVMCAMGKSRKVACVGDTGGPLMGFNKKGRMTVFGISAPMGPIPCLKTGVPSTFIDVRRYRKWIVKHLDD